MSGASGDNQLSPPNSSGLQANIISVYQSLVNMNGEDVLPVLQDGILLPIVARLAQTVWVWQTSDQEQLIKQIHTPTTIGFYQTLIPVNYVISEWLHYPSQEPVLFVEHTETPVGAPAYAYWATPTSPGSFLYNLYIIHTLGNANGDTSWTVCLAMQPRLTSRCKSCQPVMDDLFNQLGVSRKDFFTCTNGWGNTSLQPIALPGT